MSRIVRRVSALVIACAMAAPAAAQLRLTPYASGFTQPVAFVQDPTDPTVQFVAELGGTIRVIRNGAVLPVPYLDVSAQVFNAWPRGLTGLAFAPDYATSGRVFVRFVNLSGNIVVARFTRSTDPLIADPSTQFNLCFGGASAPCEIAVPRGGNYGGHLVFGPEDGYLYIGIGDGGGVDDPDRNAQNPDTLLGKMLRIDVNVPATDPVGYRNPSTNLFARYPAARPEIVGFGLHNPWRYNFDSPPPAGNGKLLIGDVGQSAWQEVNFFPWGFNMGWPTRDGRYEYLADVPLFGIPVEARNDPWFQYGSAAGTWVVAGFMYRGRLMGTAYANRRYFAGDLVSGRVWSLAWRDMEGGDIAYPEHEDDVTSELGGPVQVSSFGVDAAGELYIVSFADGVIYAMEAVPAAPVIVTQPGDPYATPEVDRTRLFVRQGDQANLAMKISGAPVPRIQWQSSMDGGATWSDIPGATQASYSLAVNWKDNTKLFRAIVSNESGSLITDTASLTVFGRIPADVDGDAKADLIIWRPGTGVWHMLLSKSGFDPALARHVQWGNEGLGDRPLLGDFDGDAISDLVVWRASTGTWYWLTSSSGYSYAAAGSQQWGNEGLGDVPFLGDVDGDGRSDLIVWRPTTGTFHWLTSSSGYSFAAAGSIQWGNAGLGDQPLVTDVDADGRADFMVWRPLARRWYWLTSKSGYSYGSAAQQQLPSAAAGDMPIAGEPYGWGSWRVLLTLWRPSTGVWSYISPGPYASPFTTQWGNAGLGDVPLTTDFDGDGHADLAVWRASTGTWHWLPSTHAFAYGYAESRQWGNQALGDIPVVR